MSALLWRYHSGEALPELTLEESQNDGEPKSKQEKALDLFNQELLCGCRGAGPAGKDLGTAMHHIATSPRTNSVK